MSVYRRYFEIKDAATLTQLAEIAGVRKTYNEAIAAMREEFGAEETYSYRKTGRLAGFGFATRPDKALWKKSEGGGYLPKFSTQFGKEFKKRLASLVEARPLESVLKSVGIKSTDWTIVDGLKFHSCSITGHLDGKRWFAVIPWRDEDPAVLEQLRQDIAAGTKTDGHLLWVPPAEWVELKEWQFNRAMEENKAAITPTPEQ